MNINLNANNCILNLSDLGKMLVKKQIKYFDVPLENAACMESTDFTRTDKYKNECFMC